jgi:beta-glucuronidase
MIEQAGNHPSILGWSVANESATGTPGGIAYFRAMREFIRSIDPGRPVSFADDNLPKLQRPEQSAANDADFLMMNQYFGSWHGPAEALEPALEQIHRLFPDKMVIISEMGFAGIFAHDAVEADQARIRTMRQQMPVLAARDWIGGAILWCYQDYKSPRNLWPGQAEGYVEHGLVDESRQRKPSYSVWRELNRPARLVAHWVGPAEQPPAGFDLAATPNTERDLPFYPLHGYRLTWAVLDAKGNAVVNGERQLGQFTTPVNITGALSAALPARSETATSPDGLIAPAAPDDRHPTYQLTVTLVSPTGSVAASEMLQWRQPLRASQQK